MHQSMTFRTEIAKQIRGEANPVQKHSQWKGDICFHTQVAKYYHTFGSYGVFDHCIVALGSRLQVI